MLEDPAESVRSSGRTGEGGKARNGTWKLVFQRPFLCGDNLLNRGEGTWPRRVTRRYLWGSLKTCLQTARAVEQDPGLRGASAGIPCDRAEAAATGPALCKSPPRLHGRAASWSRVTPAPQTRANQHTPVSLNTRVSPRLPITGPQRTEPPNSSGPRLTELSTALGGRKYPAGQIQGHPP